MKSTVSPFLLVCFPSCAILEKRSGGKGRREEEGRRREEEKSRHEGVSGREERGKKGEKRREESSKVHKTTRISTHFDR